MEKIRQVIVDEIRAVRTAQGIRVDYIDDAINRMAPMIEEHAVKFCMFVECGGGIFSEEQLADMHKTFMKFENSSI